MKAIAQDTKHRPVLKVKTALKAGYYLGLTVSAGSGTGVPDLSTTNTGTSDASTPG